MTTQADAPPPLDAGRMAVALQRNGVQYVMVGGLAAGSWGAQRPTHDADALAVCDLGRSAREVGSWPLYGERVRARLQTADCA